MLSTYHRQITQAALAGEFSQRALATIIAANTRQDGLFTGLLGHPEYHFDESQFKAGWEYVEQQHRVVLTSLTEGAHSALAWHAFGRLLHAVQDFYAHSNYLALWAQRYTGQPLPPPTALDALDPTLLIHPNLISGRLYFPLEALTYFHRLRPLIGRHLPSDSHANMNLDYPARGPLFPYAVEAARQRSTYEYHKLVEKINSPKQVRKFLDK